jgi:hypothetical protein
MKNLADTLAAKTAQLIQLQKEVEALRTAAKILGDDESETPKPKRGRKASPANFPTGTVMTQPLMVRSVLLDSATPLHIDKIVEGIKRKFGIKLKPAYLVSIIYRTMKKGNLFRKEAPNTFGLLEWPAVQQEMNAGNTIRVQ